MDRLLTMKTFLAVARLSSFTDAADELGMSRTLVSRHIADLEAHLGVRLLHRTTRAVTPTPVGYNYMALCRRVLDEIGSGEEEIAASRDQVRGEIAILCPIWLGSFGLSEAAASFGVAHPDVRIRIQFEEPSANPHDFLERGYDVCFQPAALRDSEIKVKKIGEIDFCLIASVQYAARAGLPATPGELAMHDLLVKSGETDWEFADGAHVSARTNVKWTTNSVFALCSAATAGLGIALVPQTVAGRFLVDGSVIPVLPDYPIAKRPLFVASAPGGQVPRRIGAFVAWLDKWLRQYT
ncbi:LysR family transcriptional regulator [Novosphingobium sp. SG720]|uniref:LysR family transcriptional regulator n=1 Tax=Novosphingobium sp. SG720 TaxID=2586998 RepID=UPI001446B6B2|nr:LysR family transcriptional regulator [Novosphingobium sp. SG720]NKJ44515.1 DNA-binding transcriptional LysR family regulator [Novosphingobium sp. SG720]